MDKKQSSPPSQCKGYGGRSCKGNPLADGYCKSCRGLHFEDEVANLFRLLQYSVQKNVLRSGRQLDLYVELTSGAITTRCLVECKYHLEKQVDTQEISQFVASAGPSLRAHEIDKAILVTTHGFTAHARENARCNGIECLTYGELLSKIVDFQSYLQELVGEYEASPIYSTYVELRCNRLTLHQQSSLRISGPTVKPKTIPVRFLSQVTEDFAEPWWEPVIKPLDSFALTWLASDDNFHLTIMGGFGTGKTTFCRHLAYLVARKFLSFPGPNCPIPLIIPLSDYSRVSRSTMRELIIYHLWLRCGIKITPPVLERLLHSGHLLLMLDGFDEMANQVDSRVRRQLFAKLVDLARQPTKLILTGRPEYFPSLEEMDRIIPRPPAPSNDPYESVHNLLLGHVGVPEHFAVLSLAPFSPEQIDEYLTKAHDRLPPESRPDLDRLRKQLAETYDLPDLATRPALLDIIVASLPQLEAERGRINLFRLYSIYTDIWLNRDWVKGEIRQLITREQRLSFMCQLACHLYLSGKPSIHYTKIPELIEGSNLFDNSVPLESLESDIRTCTFLKRSDAGTYGFTHRSIMEYFIALSLLGELISKRYELIKERDLSHAILTFLTEGFEKDSETLVTDLLAQDVPWVAVRNALRICSGLKIKVSGLRLDGADLREVTLHSMTFLKCSFTGASFFRATLVRLVFEDCMLDKCDFVRTTLQSVQFLDSSIRHTDFRAARFKDYIPWKLFPKRMRDTRPIVPGSSFRGSDLSRSNFRGINFRACDFSGIIIQKSKLQNCTFLACDFTGSSWKRTDLNGAMFGACSFVQTVFAQCYMRNAEFLSEPLATRRGRGKARRERRWSISRKRARRSRAFRQGYHRYTRRSDNDHLEKRETILFHSLTCSNDFRGASFRECRLDHTQLRGQRFQDAELIGCSMERALILNTTFRGCRLETLRLAGARLLGCRVNKSTLIDIIGPVAKNRRSDDLAAAARI